MCYFIRLYYFIKLMWLSIYHRYQSEVSIYSSHYSDVIMSVMTYQIISMVCSIVCSCGHQRKYQTLSLAFVRKISPMTGEFPSQRTSNAENVSIWWRHHDISHINLWRTSLRHAYLFTRFATVSAICPTHITSSFSVHKAVVVKYKHRRVECTLHRWSDISFHYFNTVDISIIFARFKSNVMYNSIWHL